MKIVKLLCGTEIMIRRAEVSDAEAMLVYLDQISRESDFLTFGPGELSTTLEEERHYLEHLQMRNNAIMLMAFMDGELVGNIHFNGGGRPRIQHSGEFGISVLEKAGGMGIGAELLKALLVWAKATGIIRKINLQVRTDNDHAISLYEKHGFISEGTLTKALCVGGVYYNNYMMGLEIK